jgi:hypothetical protein
MVPEDRAQDTQAARRDAAGELASSTTELRCERKNGEIFG